MIYVHSARDFVGPACLPPASCLLPPACLMNLLYDGGIGQRRKHLSYTSDDDLALINSLGSLLV